uniref:Uncharacterized protein n=1 Tax=Cyprinus carpio TaxID=7962 RepID=A0A8C2KX27_CYPCA
AVKFRLHWLNFDLQEQEIFTSLTAARNLLEQRAVRPLLLVEDSGLEDFTGQRLVHLYNQTVLAQDARGDVSGAQHAGMLGILVKTGKYRPVDEGKINPSPHLTCDSFPEAVNHILEHLLGSK